jgi:hypothetical protein
MTRKFLQLGRFAGAFSLMLTLGIAARAQETLGSEKAFIQESTDQLWYSIVLLLGTCALGTALFFWYRVRASGKEATASQEASRSVNPANGTYGMVSETQKDIEWVRRKKKRIRADGLGSTSPLTAALKGPAAQLSRTEEDSLEVKIFQDKMRRLQYSQLPINSFTQLVPAKKYIPLAASDDPSLLIAVEEAGEEFEEDETVRELSLRILAAFKTSNSIEGLSQIALYDLSSNLRSKAVTTLADFDHESVFETIVLACADPTREVRAAAARGLFRLSFDRAHAWKRLIETDDDYRIRHAARAAIESGIAVKSFDRLINEDLKVAYEALVVVSVLIRAGEMNEIFDALQNHRDERVKFALLHGIKVSRDEYALEKLDELRTNNSFPSGVADRIREVMHSVETVMA